LIIDVFHQEKAERKQREVFLTITNLHPNLSGKRIFLETVSALLVAAPSEENCRTLIQLFDSSRNDVLRIFPLAFTRSRLLPDIFCAIGGLTWLFAKFAESEIRLVDLVNFLIGFVHWISSPELSAKIDELDRSNSFFAIDRESLKRIAFGSPRTFVRVPSLVPFCQCPPEEVGPYNAFVIGSCVLSNLADPTELCCLAAVANRFILDKDVDRLLACFDRLSSFCDVSADHFPLFEFFPGDGNFSIQANFQAIAFWFRFREVPDSEIQLLRCGPLFATVNDGNVTVTVGSQLSIWDVDLRSWTFFYARIDRPLIRSQGICVTVGREPEIFIPCDDKFESFPCAVISTDKTAPVLYVGSAIRISDHNPMDVSVLLAEGPGFLDASELRETIILTPNSLIPDLPLNCCKVPYRSFAQALVRDPALQTLLLILQETTNSEHFSSLFICLCKAIAITAQGVWPCVCQALKIAQLPITEAVFQTGLTHISTAPKCSVRDLFLAMFGDPELWRVISPHVLLSGLFSAFPDFRWSQVPNADLFIVKIATDPKTIQLILQNSRTVPRSAKLLITLLKCYPITDWTSAMHRGDSPLQFAVLDYLTELVGARTVATVVSFISFDELKYLFVVATDPMAVRVFALMAAVTTFSPGFLRTDDVLQFRIASLTRFPSIWNDVMRLMTEDVHCDSSPILRPDLLPLWLTLVWSLGLRMCSSKRSNDELDFSVVESYLNDSCDFLNRHVATILSISECQKVILGYFPLIIHYPVLLADRFNFPGPPLSFPVIPLLNPSNMGDAADPLWARATVSVQFGSCDPPLQPKPFLADLIRRILCDSTCLTDSGDSTVIKWILESPLFGLIGSLVFHSLSYAQSLLLGDPFSDEFVPKRFFPALLLRFIGAIRLPLPPNFSVPVMHAFVYSCVRLISSNACSVLHELLRVVETVFGCQSPELVTPICLAFLSTADLDDLPGIARVFLRSPVSRVLLGTPHLADIWTVGLRNVFRVISPELANALSAGLDAAGKSAGINQRTLDQLVKRYPVVATKGISMSVFGDASFAVTRHVYIATCKHFLLAKYVQEVLA
jgi:hypothetical protein